MLLQPYMYNYDGQSAKIDGILSVRSNTIAPGK